MFYLVAVFAAIARSDDILNTLLLGCGETKFPKIVALCIASINRLITNNAVLPVRASCGCCMLLLSANGVCLLAYDARPGSLVLGIVVLPLRKN